MNPMDARVTLIVTLDIPVELTLDSDDTIGDLTKAAIAQAKSNMHNLLAPTNFSLGGMVATQTTLPCE